MARSDYGICTPILEKIQAHPDLELCVVAAAAHLKLKFGRTIRQIVSDGFPVVDQVDMTLPGDAPHDIARASGIGVMGFADVYARRRFDLLLLLGDRFEMHSAAVAAVPFLLPIAHLHGGEESTGAIDNVYRHSLTKLSHLHFVSTEHHAQRVRQMGEEDWRITVSGAPAIDHILSSPRLDRAALAARLGYELPQRFLIATYHPVTTEPGEAHAQTVAFMDALLQIDLPTLITMPNADTGGNEVRQTIQSYQGRIPGLMVAENLGHTLYMGVMAEAAAMVGNSSSGIIEAASFGLPVVNVGNRQEGRDRNVNVLDCPCETSAIVTTLRVALGSDFRATASAGGNIYGDGQASARIVDRLAVVTLGPGLIKKPFVDRL